MSGLSSLGESTTGTCLSGRFPGLENHGNLDPQSDTLLGSKTSTAVYESARTSREGGDHSRPYQNPTPGSRSGGQGQEKR